jgi:uncharacterized protein YbbK (DUF523 family)
MADATRPRVGVSRCLLGDRVRYDGGHKRDEGLLAALGPAVEWVVVCPEVEAGMGTPREAARLVLGADGVLSRAAPVRFAGVHTRTDWTDVMWTFARDRVRTLATLSLSGFVLKANSPSCGLDVPVFEANAPVADAVPVARGRGLFAQALADAFPDLPLSDERALSTREGRDDFLRRVLAFRRRP